MHHHPRRIATTALLLTLALAGVALAQAGAAIDWWVLGSGGGPAAGGSVTLDGTLGQPIAGPSAGDAVALNAGYWQEDRRAASTVALEPSANPALAGGPLTLAATVSGSHGVPTGTVTFKEGSTVLGSGSLNASGQATCDASALAVGTHTIIADYGGDLTYYGGSATLSQQVRLRHTTTSISAPAVTYHGDAAVVVTVSSTEGAPTGNVALKVDGGAEQVKGLIAGKASYTLASPTVGDHTLDATYAAQGNFGASTAAATLHVNPAATTTTVNASPAAPVYGQSVTFTATVTAMAPGSGTPTGTVTFMDGATVLGSAVLDGSGKATLSTASLAVGARTISVEYAGDGNYTTSSGTCSLTVKRADTTTALVAAPAASVCGQGVTFSATVTVDAPGSGTPTGSITFRDGAATLGSGLLDGAGTATLSTTSLAVGRHTITAEYAGDGNVQGSSATCDAVVAKAGTTTALSASPAASVYGQAVTFTAIIAAVAPGAGTPTGSVTFRDGGVAIGSGTLDASGTATLSISSLAVGSHAIAAEYGGDRSYLTSSGALGAPHAVAKAATTTAIVDVTPGPASLVGQAVTVRYGVSVTAPGSGTPTGTVTVSDGSDSCSNTVAAGQCSLTLTTAGDRTLTAGYSGDASFLASTSAGVAQHINSRPVANAGGPYSGDEGAAITFDGSGSSDPDPGETATLRYEWAFGDGTTGTGQTPAHTYARSGSYIATLTITDGYGASDSDTAVVTVRNVAPTLSGQFDQLAAEGTLTSFNLGRFADPGPGPWTVRVEWGDGTPAATFDAAAPGALGLRPHAYDDDGTYAARVTVSDGSGASDTATFRAIIRNVAPTVTIDPHAGSGPGGTQVGLWAHPSDPSAADTRAGFEYQWSLKRDGVEVGTGSADSLGFSIPAGDGAIYLAEVQAKDKDGGIGSASWHMRAEVRSAIDARIQILWPHGGLPVREATLANLSAWLLEPGTLRPAALRGDPVVCLWRALNNGPAGVVATGVRRGASSLYDFNNVDVSAARDGKNKLFFWVSVAGVETHSNVWIHAQDGRTYAPTQDVPTVAGYSGSPVDARIEILWPHGGAAVRRAERANLTAMLFRPGTLESAAPDWGPTPRLWCALDNGVAEEVGVGVRRLVTKNGLTYPVWDFNNVDISAARDPAHKLIFTLTVDGVEAHSNVWVHGVDARTIFPAWDVVE
ncbi:MAG TPA: Ig-like domain repeat protein [Anaerolineae bacterium]|nr:Ig-like domain repeat protein [Anaerolineae bacterium]HOR00864.1 Ig-like domain repeat protein [Anaerolineae bacterium]HPL29608.1 Ig-like domain repeat protein [Anaerolineae bacterium]